MKFIVSNNIKVINPNLAIKNYCTEKLTLDNPTYLTAEKLGKYLGNIPPKMKLYVKNGSDLILPFGTLSDIWKMRGQADFSYEVNIPAFKGSNLVGDINLYDYQQKAVNALKQGKNGVLQAPCGSGKTQIGLALIKAIGGRTLWLTHTSKLLTQSLERCKKYFSGDFGTITEGDVHLGKDITFATVQTMSKLDIETYKNEFDIVIVDECHHCVGSPSKVMQFYKILTNCNCRYKYGLSATLSRGDNLINCVYSIIGKILYTINPSDVGAKIIKAEHKAVDVDIRYDIRSYCNFDGTLDYNKLINLLSFDDNRNKIIINNVLAEYKNNKKQLLLCHRVKQVEELARVLQDTYQIEVNCITGKVKEREYTASVIVATYTLAKEGLDIPELDVLHLVTPQKNESTTIQAIGRIERNIDGKDTPICYDYVDVNIPYCLGCFKKRKNLIKKH